MKISTKCVQTGWNPKSGEPRVLPLYQSTTFAYDTAEEMAFLFDSPKNGHIYSRISNPTNSALETKMAELCGGVGAMTCSSGMAATLLSVLTVANAGDNIIALSTIYGGTYNLFSTTLPKLGINVKIISPELSAEEVEKLIDDRTKMLFGETIANPSIGLLDFEKYAKICNKHQIVFAVDNTLATPVLVRPFEHGANVEIHSTTKYLDGHASAVGGMVVDAGNFKFDGNPRYQDFWTPDESYHGVVYVEEGGSAAFILKARMQYQRDIGAQMSPFNAYITNLGTETLHLRMKAHSENADKLAHAIENHKNVDWVKYPSLDSFADKDSAEKYWTGGFSGMMAVGIKGGRDMASKFISNLKLFKQVTHIADTRSCVLHPATTTHRQLSDSDLIACGITAGLVRLSVGIEDSEDIIADVLNALDSI